MDYDRGAWPLPLFTQAVVAGTSAAKLLQPASARKPVAPRLVRLMSTYGQESSPCRSSGRAPGAGVRRPVPEQDAGCAMARRRPPSRNRTAPGQRAAQAPNRRKQRARAVPGTARLTGRPMESANERCVAAGQVSAIAWPPVDAALRRHPGRAERPAERSWRTQSNRRPAPSPRAVRCTWNLWRSSRPTTAHRTP